MLYLVPALNELDGDLLPCSDVFGQLHETEGASVEVCHLRGSDGGMLNLCACRVPTMFLRYTNQHVTLRRVGRA